MTNIINLVKAKFSFWYYIILEKNSPESKARTLFLMTFFFGLKKVRTFSHRVF